MILCSGCFDGLHAGHVAYLTAAAGLREVGEPLVVAVACDAYVERHKQRTPGWTAVDRMRVVDSLTCVHRVVVHDADGVASVIDELKPRILVKGDDWRGYLPDDVLAACQQAGTEIHYVPQIRVPHTSQVRR